MLEHLAILFLSCALSFIGGYALSQYQKSHTKAVIKAGDRPAQAFSVIKGEATEDSQKPYAARIVSPATQRASALDDLSDL